MSQALAQVGRLAYTPDEAAVLIGLSRATIYRMVENGSLPHKRIGARGKGERGGIIIPATALVKWLATPDEPRVVKAQRELEKIIGSVRNGGNRGKRK